ncbi:protein POF1B isoform 2-T2 [Anomaloglossus baeobatrachus]|uniref:protein POF1B isoform X2 n=1 Tax=Anomaloglossus baeobatrachus TaxID=238106 RepID=UPI003F50B048
MRYRVGIDYRYRTDSALYLRLMGAETRCHTCHVCATPNGVRPAPGEFDGSAANRDAQRERETGRGKTSGGRAGIMSTSNYWVSENGSVSDKDNVFIERVRTYSPITKAFHVLDNSGPLSPISPGSGVQSMVWAPEQQVHHQYQEVQSPGPYTQGTIRRYIVQNQEQELQAPYTQGTIRRYIVQNPEPEIQTYPHETVRRYIVQNPEQNYVSGVNYIPSNNVIYEKTIRRVEKANPEERQTQMIRGSSVSSINDQVIESSQSQSKVSVQSSEEVVSEQNVQKVSVQNVEQHRSSSSSSSGPEQLDARYFGELLAELSRKNNDLYSCLLTHVEKIGARKPSDSEYQSEEDIESLIPKGVSELTKQQIRYLLQMRRTSDKSMRLVLSTFSSLRDDLGHLQNDLNKLEIDKKSLERDLTFKDEQIKEYDTILASLREKNRQQQQEIKDGQMKLRGVEENILAMRNAESDKDYRLKEMEYAKNALQQENKNLRVQVTETVSSPLLQTKTDEITRQYKDMIDSLREEKDKEIRTLRSQISKFQHDVVSREGSSSDLQMRLQELTSSLEERDSLIRRQQEELFRLRQQRETKSVSQEVITRNYSHHYPILRLLSDYKDTSPSTGTQTIVVERRHTSRHE